MTQYRIMDKFVTYLKDCTRDYEPPSTDTDLHGWMDENILKVFELTDIKFMVEVGSWKGLSAVTFGEKLKKSGGTLLCIDTWLGAPEFWTEKGLKDPTRGLSLKQNYGYPMVYYTFLSNLKNKGLGDTIVPFPISSDQGAGVLDHYKCQADAIYIDAAHEQGAVYKDIETYWKFVRPGGVLFGDDFSPSWPGVKHDVAKFAKNVGRQYTTHGKVWFITK